MPFHVISPIKLLSSGPHSWQVRRWRPIHLSQGCLDGACGPYSVVMTLLILGLLRWDEATSYGFWFDPDQAKGKFWSRLARQPGLLRDGSDLKELEKLLRSSFGPLLATSELAPSEELIPFTVANLRQQCPVIIGVRYSGGAHWLVIVGYEEDEQGNVTKLLALDSSSTKPQLTAGNAFIDIAAPAKGKQYKFTWANAAGEFPVKLEDSLTICKAR